MSRPPARHRKPSRVSSAPSGRASRHRKASPLASALRHKPARVAAAAAGAILVASAGSTAATWTGGVSHLPTSGQISAFDSLEASAHLGLHASLQAGKAPPASRSAARAPELLSSGLAGRHAGHPARKRHSAGRAGRHRKPEPTPQATAAATATAATLAYRNPLRDVSGLIPERIDQGVDFGGSGPVYALGDAVITNATGNSAGWPGGGWITYQLTDGPDAGLMVFLAEDVTPTVQVGQHVTSSTVIANMFNGGDGIETGWATADGSTAESQLSEAGGISGNGPFPTMVGLNFEEMLQALGVPAANNWGSPGNGVLPSQYPAWK